MWFRCIRREICRHGITARRRIQPLAHVVPGRTKLVSSGATTRRTLSKPSRARLVASATAACNVASRSAALNWLVRSALGCARISSNSACRFSHSSSHPSHSPTDLGKSRSTRAISARSCSAEISSEVRVHQFPLRVDSGRLPCEATECHGRPQGSLRCRRSSPRDAPGDSRRERRPRDHEVAQEPVRARVGLANVQVEVDRRPASRRTRPLLRTSVSTFG